MDNLAGILVLVTLAGAVLIGGLSYLQGLKSGRTMVRRAQTSDNTAYSRNPIQSLYTPIGAGPLVMVVASAMFFAGFVGLLVVGHYHG